MSSTGEASSTVRFTDLASPYFDCSTDGCEYVTWVVDSDFQVSIALPTFLVSINSKKCIDVHVGINVKTLTYDWLCPGDKRWPMLFITNLTQGAINSQLPELLLNF